MLTEKFGNFAQNTLDHAYSALFGASAAGVSTALGTAPTFLGYAAANSLGAPTAVSILTAGAVCVASLGVAAYGALAGGGTAIALGVAGADKLGAKEMKKHSAAGGAVAGVLTALYISASIAGGSDEPTNQTNVELPAATIQIEPSQPLF